MESNPRFCLDRTSHLPLGWPVHKSHRRDNTDNASHFHSDAQAFFYVESRGRKLLVREYQTKDRWQSKVSAESVHGRRIALLADYIRPMRDLREQLARGRKEGDLKLDGKLDEPFWVGNWVYELRDLETGKPPRAATSFRMGWTNEANYFGIRCEDRDTKNLNIGTTKNEDGNLWNGDCLKILLETQSHSYYQLAFNSAGALIDLDRKKGLDTLWSSGGKIATHMADDHWTAEIRIPVVGAQQATLNPQYGVAGREPTISYPWYFNVCRQPIRSNERETSAFSPTGAKSFHDQKKFGTLHVRKRHMSGT